MQRAHSRSDKMNGRSGGAVLVSSPGVRVPVMGRSATEGVSAIAAASLDTFPKRLLDHAARRGGSPANREKDYGIWQSWTWRDVAGQIGDLPRGLAAAGLQSGVKLTLIRDTRPRVS